MAEIVLHLWETDDEWEIRASDEEFALASRATRDQAIAWCEEHAEEIGATVVFVWELAEMRRLVA